MLVPWRLPTRRFALSSLLLVLATTAPLAARAAGKSPAIATQEEKAEAQARFVEGAKAFEAKRYDEAVKAFRASYDVVASPNSHLMIERVMREQGDLVAAYEEAVQVDQEARRLAKEDKHYEATAAKIALDLEELKKLVAFVSVTIKGAGAGASLKVGGREIPAARWDQPIATSVGSTEVVVTSADGRKATKTASPTAGTTASVELELTPQPAAGPPPVPVPAVVPTTNARDDAAPADAAPADAAPPSKSLLPYALVAGGVGVAGFVLFAVAGSMNQSTFADLKTKCVNNVCPPASQSDIDKGKTTQTLGNVGLIVGAVGVATGVTLLVVDRTRGKKKAGPGVGSVLVGPGGIALRGDF